MRICEEEGCERQSASRSKKCNTCKSRQFRSANPNYHRDYKRKWREDNEEASTAVNLLGKEYRRQWRRSARGALLSLMNDVERGRIPTASRIERVKQLVTEELDAPNA